jgi:hypothetical protein
MNEDQEKSILDLTQKIIISLADKKTFDNKKEVEKVFAFLESMEFFVEQGDYDRVIDEATHLLNKLNDED